MPMREHEAPGGHVGTPEAAEALDVTVQTVRNMLRRGELEGMMDVVDEATGQKRHYVLESSLREAAAKRGSPARREDVEKSGMDAAHFVNAHAEILASEILGELRSIREERREQHRGLMEVLGELKAGQKTFLASRERYIEALEEMNRHRDADREIFREQAEREKRYQERMIEFVEEYGVTLKENREILGKIEASGPEQKTSWWKRWFGAG